MDGGAPTALFGLGGTLARSAYDQFWNVPVSTLPQPQVSDREVVAVAASRVHDTAAAYRNAVDGYGSESRHSTARDAERGELENTMISARREFALATRRALPSMPDPAVAAVALGHHVLGMTTPTVRRCDGREPLCTMPLGPAPRCLHPGLHPVAVTTPADAEPADLVAHGTTVIVGFGDGQ